MKEEYQSLFTPWKIGNVTVKNRIVLAPMGGTCIFGWMEPSHFDTEAADLLMTIAKNNCGLIIPGIAPVKDIIGGRWLYENKKKFKQLEEWVFEVHRTGAKVFIQLTAGFGRAMALNDSLASVADNRLLSFLAKPVFDTGYLTAAPSRLPNRWADIESRPMTVKEIDKIIFAFGETAFLLQQAGVDGVEVHAVHEGYLLDQFTLPYTNRRTDDYGGSFENRYRFPVEIVREIKDRCGNDFPVSLRYSVISKTKDFRYGAMPGEDYHEIGRDMQESEKAAKYLQDAGYDMLNCDNGTYDAWYWSHPPVYMPYNCNLSDVEHISQFVDIPVVSAGRMQMREAAESISSGKITAAAFGRQFLVDPAWVTKTVNDQEDDIMPCICCHNACFNMSKYEGHGNTQAFEDTRGMCRCALNPQTMQSSRYKIYKASASRKVAVIGGGIGGMEAARVLKKRGHSPVIYEKSERLGGVFQAAASSTYKDADRALLKWYEHQMEKLEIPVYYNTEVTDLSMIDEEYVIVATGSVPKHIPVIGSKRAVDAAEFLLHQETAGDDVVIVGGGLSGCEIAYDLHMAGKKPVIVEMKDDLMRVDGLCMANSSYLKDYFKTNDVPVYLNAAVKCITDTAVYIETKEHKVIKLKADTLISSIGYSPAPLQGDKDMKKRIYFVGDCKEVGNLRTVIWSAWDAGMKI